MIELTAQNIPYMFFSQTGEDQVVHSYQPKQNGFFVDVGAFHPFAYSNTFALYLRGWRGINIEPNPDVMGLFQQLRPEDITLNLGVSKKEQELGYISFSEPSCNTFLENYARAVMANDSGSAVQYPARKIPTRPLVCILDEYFPKNQTFDLLTVDTEGMDLEVLESSDWEKYRPELVLAEDHLFNMESPQDSELFKFMKSKNYTLFAKTVSTVMFQESGAFAKRKKFEVESNP